MSDYLGRIITKTPTYPSPTVASGVWTLDEALQYQKAGKWPPGYAISRSVRLRSSASAYFQRTPAASGNRQTYTWSGWVKRGLVAAGTYYALFTAGQVTGGDDGLFFDTTAGALYFTPDQGATSTLISSSVYRDPSAWYHIVLAVDTTQATSTNRIKMYVNGVQLTSFSTATYPAQNLNSTFMNTANIHRIGAHTNAGYYFDGYMTEINFIDGQALTPDYFGYADTATGVWQPLPYTGIYGTNGFYLNFKDPASTTTIGYDYSGNSNNFTANNVSVTSGATYDSMVDSPSMYGADTGVGGEVRGNYAVLNPIWKGSTVTLSNGNLAATNSTNAANAALSTIGVPAGNKIYWEMTITSLSDAYRLELGMVSASYNQTTVLGSTTPAGSWNQNAGNTQGQFLVNTASVFGPVSNVNSVNDVFMFAYDDATNRIWVGKNGTWFNSGAPASGTGYVGTLTSGNVYFPAAQLNTSTGSNAIAANFGQRAFAYTAPTGFQALCSQNIPVPTINNGANYMAATLWSGSGASVSITNTVNNISFQPDFVWTKNRSSVTNHYLWDSVRGALKELYSNLSNAESTNTIGLSAFNSNGFTLNNGDTAWNASGQTYVGWNWKAGGTAVSNTSGTITSSVSANTTAGFSIVSYTGNATAGATVGHGLGVAPSMVIAKYRGGVGSWAVYHSAIGATNWILLNGTAGQTTSAQEWNNTAPTSTVFTVGNASSNSNQAGTNIAYCFVAIAGYSAFGSYTGNGSADGPFVYLGFRPRFVMWKNASAAEAWLIEDTARSTYNEVALELYPSSSGAEAAGSSRSPTQQFDYLSNGFKVRGAQTQTNGSGNTIIYAAFAENPFKYARAR
jgi:hypothetical protein